MEKRLEETLTALLEAEAEARSIVEKAENDARKLRDQTRKEAQRILEDAKAQEEQEIQRILNEVRTLSAQIRNDILDDAKKQAQHWEELYQRNYEKAVNFVIDHIISNKPL